MKTIYEMSAAEKSEMIAFLKGIGYNAIRIGQNEPELTEEPRTDNYKAENKEALKPAQEPSNKDLK